MHSSSSPLRDTLRYNPSLQFGILISLQRMKCAEKETPSAMILNAIFSLPLLPTSKRSHPEREQMSHLWRCWVMFSIGLLVVQQSRSEGMLPIMFPLLMMIMIDSQVPPPLLLSSSCFYSVLNWFSLKSNSIVARFFLERKRLWWSIKHHIPWQENQCEGTPLHNFGGRFDICLINSFQQNQPGDISDFNCNGIHGVNPATGKLYKDELCSQSGPQGVIVMGASAQVRIFIHCLQHRNLVDNNRLTLRSHRSGWMLPRSISQPMMMSSLQFKTKWIGLIEAGISFSLSRRLVLTF